VNDIINWAQHSPTDDFWITAGVLVATTVGGFVGSFWFYLRKRVIEDTPTSLIRSAAQGYIELNGTGKLMDGPPILAPLTGSVCTWFSYQIEERRRSGKRTNWVTVEQGTSDELFLLEDETGICVIDPEGASVTPSARDIWYGATRQPTTGPSPRRGGFTFGIGSYRYCEHRMNPGDPLYALGLFKTVGGAGGAFNVDADVRELLRAWKRDSERLLREYDANKDGEVDMEEWQKVREAAYKTIMEQHADRKTAMPSNIMARTGDVRRPYILSALPQASLERRYALYTSGLIVLFFLAGSAATWLIGMRLTTG